MHKIGCDLDGVVFDTIPECVQVLNRLAGTSYSVKDLNDYDFESVPEWTEKMVEAAIHTVISSDSAPPMAGIALLQDLRELEAIDPNIIFISQRDVAFYRVTMQALTRLFPKPWTLIPGIPKGQKWQVIRENKIAFFMEDCLEEAVNIIQHTSCTTFLFDAPYNRGSMVSPRGWQPFKGLPLLHRVPDKARWTREGPWGRTHELISNKVGYDKE